MSALTPLQTVLKDTSGRDKVSKLLQYVTKLVSWNIKSSSELNSTRLSKCSNSIGDARRVFRFFNEIFQIQTLLNVNVSKLSDPQYLMEYIQAATNANYLVFDHLRWLRLFSVIDGDIETFKNRSNLSLFYSTVCGFIINLIKIITLVKTRETTKEKETQRQNNLKKLCLSNIRIVPDLIISSSAAKITEVFNNDGFISLCGVISSFYGIYEQWPAPK